MAENNHKRPCVFLDRDGTINEEMGYINHVARMRLVPGAARAVKRLNDHEVFAVVVSNQAGVARGYFSEELVQECMSRMEDSLADEAGAHLDAIYQCPYHPDGVPPYNIDSRDRKPKPGMVEKACADLPIDMDHSYMVGDRRNDVTFGRALGLKTVLVLTGYGLGEWEHHRAEFDYEPDHVANDLASAVDWILEDLALTRVQAEARRDAS